MPKKQLPMAICATGYSKGKGRVLNMPEQNFDRRAPRIRSKVVQISYSDDMDHLLVLRDKIGRLREEIAEIQKLNEQFRRDGLNGAEAHIAHGQRNERLQAIQHELIRLSDLGRKVVSTEQMREKHRTRLRLVKQKRAS